MDGAGLLTGGTSILLASMWCPSSCGKMSGITKSRAERVSKRTCTPSSTSSVGMPIRPSPPRCSSTHSGWASNHRHLVHARDGRCYLYFPTVSAEAAGESALRRVVASFFEGSAALALLQLGDGPDDTELATLEAAIRQAREEGC